MTSTNGLVLINDVGEPQQGRGGGGNTLDQMPLMNA